MRAATVATLFFALGSVALAKDPPAYEKAVLVKMDSSACGYSEKDGKTIAGEIFGTDGQHKNTRQVLCQEYVLQTDRVVYRIQPKDDKHPVLLPVGETAQFRIHKDKMLLRVPEADGKEREYLFSLYSTYSAANELPLVRCGSRFPCPSLTPAST